MELIKDLPEIFEKFANQRKNSFLAVKELKDKGIPIVGTFCTYLPQELILAAGAIPVGLCSMSDEPIGEAEKVLPGNLCPLIKSSYGFAKTDQCPFFYFSDLIVGETTCDGKKKMYEYLGEFKRVHVMELPNAQSRNGLELWKKEIQRFRQVLENTFDIKITEDQVRAAVALKNKERAALKELSYLMAAEPAPMLGQDLYKILYGAAYKFNREENICEIQRITETVRIDFEMGKRLENRPRLIITGCPLGGATEKLIRVIEDNGGVVVAFENCSGMKAIDRNIDERSPDIYEAIAERYLAIGCSCMSPNPNRLELLGRMIDEFHADAVIDMILQACHTYNVETFSVRRFVREQKGLPYMSVETDFSQSDIGQLSTRMAAFMEIL